MKHLLGAVAVMASLFGGSTIAQDIGPQDERYQRLVELFNKTYRVPGNFVCGSPEVIEAINGIYDMELLATSENEVKQQATQVLVNKNGIMTIIVYMIDDNKLIACTVSTGQNFTRGPAFKLPGVEH